VDGVRVSQIPARRANCQSLSGRSIARRRRPWRPSIVRMRPLDNCRPLDTGSPVPLLGKVCLIATASSGAAALAILSCAAERMRRIIGPGPGVLIPGLRQGLVSVTRRWRRSSRSRPDQSSPPGSGRPGSVSIPWLLLARGVPGPAASYAAARPRDVPKRAPIGSCGLLEAGREDCGLGGGVLGSPAERASGMEVRAPMLPDSSVLRLENPGVTTSRMNWRDTTWRRRR